MRNLKEGLSPNATEGSIPCCWRNRHTRSFDVNDRFRVEILSRQVSTAAPYLERVLVHQVQWVPRELGATTGVAAGQISILVPCSQLSTAEVLDKTVVQEDKRVICQIKSLETLVRSAAIVTV